MPNLYPLIANRGPAVKWMVLVAVLMAISAAGSIVGGVIVFVLHLEPGVPLSALLVYGVRLSIFLALLVGVVHAMVILLQARLHATETRLHAQEIQYEQALKLASEARLAALEARIHPHFLFNALNTVSSLIPTAPAHAEISGGIHPEDFAALGDVHLVRVIETQDGPIRGRMRRLRSQVQSTLTGKAVAWAKSRPAGARLVQSRVGRLLHRVVGPLPATSDAYDYEAWIEKRVATRESIYVIDSGPGFSAADLPAGHGLDTLCKRLTVLFGDEEPLRIVHRDGWTTVAFRVRG